LCTLSVFGSENFPTGAESSNENVVNAPSVQTLLDKRSNLLPLLVTKLPCAEGNAADDYIKSLEILQSREILDASWIEKGAEKKYCNFYPDYFEVVTSSGFPPAHVFNLISFANKLRAKAEEMWSAGQSDEALRIYEKIVIYGWHVEKEKLTLVQVGKGLDIQSIGVKGLQDIYAKSGRTERKVLCDNYIGEIEKTIDVIKKKARPAYISDESAIRMLLTDNEPLWRRWAISVLGRRFSYPKELFNVKKSVQLSERTRAKAIKKTIENEKDPLTRETARVFLALLGVHSQEVPWDPGGPVQK
jgi:hypothetical protein